MSCIDRTKEMNGDSEIIQPIPSLPLCYQYSSMCSFSSQAICLLLFLWKNSGRAQIVTLTQNRTHIVSCSCQENLIHMIHMACEPLCNATSAIAETPKDLLSSFVRSAATEMDLTLRTSNLHLINYHVTKQLQTKGHRMIIICLVF